MNIQKEINRLREVYETLIDMDEYDKADKMLNSEILPLVRLNKIKTTKFLESHLLADFVKGSQKVGL